MIEVQSLTKKYGSTEALKSVSFRVDRGHIVGFLGPNGAGKTTTMRIITGYMPATSGTVTIDGVSLFDAPRVVRKKIGYLPENVALYSDMTVREYLLFIAGLRDVKRRERKEHIATIASQCGIAHVLDQITDTLSKGYRQRVGLAQTLIGNPEVLILDEPTVGLDPKQISEIRSLIKKLGKEKTILLSTHILPEVEMVCDRVVIINEGSIVAQGTPDTLSAGLEQQTRFALIVKGDAAVLERAFSALPEVKQVVVRELPEQSVFSFEIIASARADLRQALARIVVEKNYDLLELKKEQLDLEDIFLKLVTREKKS